EPPGAGTGGCADGENVLDGRVAACVVIGEGHEIEAGKVAVDEVGERRGQLGDLSDLVGAVHGEGADRYQPGLDHPVPGHRDLEPVGDLQQHGVTGLEAEVEQPSCDLIGAAVELAVGESSVGGGDGKALGMEV